MYGVSGGVLILESKRGDPVEFDFPLRQRHIADATGLTPVHVSKVLSEERVDQTQRAVADDSRFNGFPTHREHALTVIGRLSDVDVWQLPARQRLPP